MSHSTVETPYTASENRYETIPYRRSGRSGLDLPAFSFGLWQKFGTDYPFEAQREIILHAFDLGITHFDNADRYGPPHRAAQKNFGRILGRDLAPYRDEIILSTKAGNPIGPGPTRRAGRASRCWARSSTACVTSAPTTSTSSTVTVPT